MLHLNEFMKQLSYEMELEEPLKPETNGNYILPLEEDLSLAIGPAEGGLFFSSEICKCPTIKREEFLTELMHADLFGQGTSNALLGLTKKGDKITLTRYIAHEIDYKEFSEILEDFINAIDCWVEESKNFK